MSDPRPLIEHVGEMLVERETRIAPGLYDERETHLSTEGKSVLLLNLIRSLYAEANMPLASKPHHNEMFNFYSHRQDVLCGRVRDSTPIEIPSELYTFESLREYAPQCNIKNSGKIYKNCVVRIIEIPCSVANSLLLTCREISQNQPITDLYIHTLHCDKSHPVPADVFNLSKTAQSITIMNSILPRNLMEHLISQLRQCKYLRKLLIENITLYIQQSKQTSKEELSVTKMSAASSKTQNQLSKWGLEFQTSNQSHGNSLLLGDMVLFLSECKMLTQLNLNESIVGKAGIHIVEMINRLGLDSPLQLLCLRNCSIPSGTLREILKSLRKCKQLTHLDLSGHNLKNDEKYLGELFKTTEVDPILQQLHLQNCSIPEVGCREILKYLSECRNLTHLNLTGNKVGKEGIHIVEIVENSGLKSPLQILYLRDCSIPSDTLREILKYLTKCKQLTHLDLGGHSLENVEGHLVELIKSFGVNPLLQHLYLQNCSILEKDCNEMLQYLSEFRHLTHLNLNGNRLGMAGIHTVEIMNTLDSALQSLCLRNCSIPNDTLREILKSLKKCKQLTDLDLGGNNLENYTGHLIELFQSFGVDPPLQCLYLPNCSIQEKECTEMLECLSEFRNLTLLDLSGNRLGKAGIHIVKMVERAGINSPLQLLHLRDCSIPTDALREILKSLRKCKQLTHLDLGGHNLKDDGKYLGELFKTTDVDPILQQLYLPNCSIQEKDCTEMFQCLSEFRHLSHLNLNGNKVGKAGIHIVKMVERAGLDSALKLLCLRNCSIPNDTLREILKSLKKCKQLTHLDLGGNNLENYTGHLIEFFQSFGVDPPLQCLYLPNCSIQEKECTEMLECLSEFRNLTLLDLSGNRLGKAGIHIVKMVERAGINSPLQLLHLRDCSIPTDALREILKSLRKCKQLTHLDLAGHNLKDDGKYLGELFKTTDVDPILQQLYLPNCSIQEKDCTEMFQCLSEFRHLSHLNLNGNKVGKAGIHIVKMVERAGLDSALKLLCLRNCSIPNDTLREILKSLKKCKQLTHLDLGGNNLENYTGHLIEFFQSFGIDPPLQCLYLPNCSIQEKECTEMLECLSEFRNLTLLDLSGNRLGKAGIHIVKMVERAGINSPLQLLHLRDCSIPTDALREILKSLRKCKQLTHLDLAGHNLKDDGKYLGELFKTTDIDPILQQLYLPNCSIQEKDCTEMFQCLSEFRHLSHLNLNGNKVGKAGIHIVKMVERAGLDSALKLLCLRNCSIPNDTLREILKSLKKCKQLTHLDLGGNNLENYTGHLIEFFQSVWSRPTSTVFVPSKLFNTRERMY